MRKARIFLVWFFITVFALIQNANAGNFSSKFIESDPNSEAESSIINVSQKRYEEMTFEERASFYPNVMPSENDISVTDAVNIALEELTKIYKLTQLEKERLVFTIYCQLGFDHDVASDKLYIIQFEDTELKLPAVYSVWMFSATGEVTQIQSIREPYNIVTVERFPPDNYLDSIPKE